MPTVRTIANEPLDLVWVGVSRVPVPTLLINANTCEIIRVNQAATELFNFKTLQEISGLFMDGLHPGMLTRISNAALSADGAVTDMPVRIISRGINISLGVSVVPLLGLEGEYALLLAQRLPGVPGAHSLPGFNLVRQILSRTNLPGAVFTDEMGVEYRNAAWQGMPECIRLFLENDASGANLCWEAVGVEAISVEAWQRTVDRVLTLRATCDYRIDFGKGGVWQVILYPCQVAGHQAVACFAVSSAMNADLLPPPLVSKEGEELVAFEPWSRQSVTALDTERSAIAREIHDSLGQDLTVLRFGLRRFFQDVLALPDVPSRLMRESEKLRQQLDAVSATTRRVAHELRGANLAHTGFSPAVVALIASFEERVSMEGQFEIAAGWEEPEGIVGWDLYRSLQELLNNVAKHSKANRFGVRLKLTADQYHLQVSDDGIGMPSPAPGVRAQGSILRSLEDRATSAQGVVKIRSRPEVPGTIVDIVLPAQSRVAH